MRLVLLAATLLIACGKPVREDRTIEWSTKGDRVAFQHGDNGVFVADADGGPARKIHAAAPGVTATSTPQWAPDGKRLIFTTAVGGPKPQMFFAPEPAGNLFFEHPARYTCWLREEERSRELFVADVGHVGYVAANLAVRWHPDGGSILYVNTTADRRHALYTFDLERRVRRRAFPYDAEALVFDWAPDGRLVCVLDGDELEPEHGMWIGRIGGPWTPVPGSTPGRAAKRAEEPGALARVRAMRPVWAPDGRSFAFAVRTARGFALRLRDTNTHTLAAGPRPIRDLHWHPDGKRLGYRAGDGIHVARSDAAPGPRLNGAPARRFAGWNAAGDTFAYTTPDEIPHVSAPVWSFLLRPAPRARDAVRVRDDKGDREVFAGMRVTFPTWSPTKNELSLWFTFAPTHRMPASALLGWSLLPGDPAAIFRPATGAIRWLTVNGQEEAQVGHYHLLRREYEKAWTWYERAAAHATEPRRDRPDALPLFRAHCLAHLGRHEEAAREEAAFVRGFVPDGEELLREHVLLTSVLRALYRAEVLCSLDASDIALSHLRSGAPVGDAIAAGQVMLLQQRYEEYVDWTMARVAPRLFADTKAQELMMVFDFIALGALLPLMTPSFMEGIPTATATRVAKRWTALRKATHDTRLLWFMDRALAAAHGRAGDEAAAAGARRRARESGFALGFLVNTDDPEAIVEALRRWH